MLKNELIIAVAPLPGLPTTWRSSTRHGGAGSCTSGVAVAINAGRAGVVAVAEGGASGDADGTGGAEVPPQPASRIAAAHTVTRIPCVQPLMDPS